MQARAEAQNDMIRNQLERRGIADNAVLAAFAKVDRSLFVLPEFTNLTFADEPLPICCGQTISQPYVVAKMTEALSLNPEATVLEIGTGSGYQTAILAELAKTVYSLEIIPGLHETAKARLASLGYTNIHAFLGDGYGGYPAAAPYDAIIVTAAPPSIPESLIDQLAIGGRLILPVGTREQMLQLVTKAIDGNITIESIFPVIFVPMKKGGMS